MSNMVKVREKMASYIKDYNSRILELGPLNRCLLDRSKYNNYFFGDIRSTSEIKKLYLENEYLKRTNLSVKLEEIIEIDYVIKESYKKTFKKEEKFDYIIVSHVLEHIPDLLNFFIDIKNILKKDGEIIIIYPDKRFCFDYFRENSTFSDIYDIYKNGQKYVARRVLDFYTNVISENNPTKFWDIKNKIEIYNKDNVNRNIKAYNMVSKKGIMEDDIHYWPFADYAFIKFLYDCKIYGYLPFSIKEFIPTQLNTQEFLVILSFNLKSGDNLLKDNMEKAHMNFVEQYSQTRLYKEKIQESDLIIGDLQKAQLILEEKYLNLKDENAQLKDQLIERSRIRYMIKSVIIKSWSHFKRVFLYCPKKIIDKLRTH